MSDALNQATQLIREADSLILCAGAGMGVDSGLPDFRGPEGFWRAYPDLKERGIRFEAIANPAAFDQHPELAWRFYGHRADLYRRTRPHGGFTTLKRWGDSKPGGAFVFTSNVDGHFQKAGFSEGQIHECHGSLQYLQCTRPCRAFVWPLPQRLAAQAPPTCPECGALARPNILMFGDTRWVDERSEQQASAFERWFGRVSKPVALELGAGTAVPTVRYFATGLGVPVIRVNPHEPGIGRPHLGLALGAREAIEAIDRAL